MLVKEWTWNSPQTQDTVCFVSNLLYADFLYLIEENELISPGQTHEHKTFTYQADIG